MVKKELKHLDVLNNSPESIFSVLHLKFNFSTNTTDLLSGVLYDGNGSLIPQYEPLEGFDVVLNPLYRTAYYYVLDKLSNNNEFEKSKSPMLKLDEFFDKNGKKHLVYFDKLTISSNANNIYCYIYTFGLALTIPLIPFL